MKFEYQCSSKEELDLMHESILDILEKTGVVFEFPKAVEVFQEHGAKIDGKRVFIPRKLVEDAIKSAPRSFEWYGRNSVIDVKTDNSIIAPAYGPIYTYKEGVYANATAEDFINFQKLHETSKVIDVACAMVTEPFEIDVKIRNDYRSAATLMYSTKPVIGVVGNSQTVQKSIDMTRSFYGVEDDRTVLFANINCASPLHFSPEMAETLYTQAINNQACTFTGGSLVGLTSPPTRAGHFVLTMAEAFAGFTLSQLVRPGCGALITPHIPGTDLRYNSWVIAGPENAFDIALSRDISKYYDLPVRVNGPEADSKITDFQCGKETMLTTMASLMSGAALILQACGIMDSFNTIGYEKLIFDEEAILCVRHFLKGYEMSPKTIMADKIISVGPGGKYMERTPKSYREEFLLTDIDIRDTHGNWLANNKETAESRATKAWKKRIEEYQLPEMDDVQKKIVKENIPKEYMF